ncbi:MAG TPA: DUF1579 domain-containing protein [Thermoanaerobaculaceae bacterium]|nr:DUF1579 domain-containing protein [Thermoanaerobaculaceae bacterium]
MRMRTVVSVVAAVALSVAAAMPAIGQQEGKQPEMTAEQKAAMEAWMKAATPGEGHKVLDPMIGSWNVTMTMWEKPGAPGQTSVGTAENTWMLGGRFVQESLHGEVNGMKFEGLGYTGFDNFKKQYVGAWMDTMGTMMMTMTGTADPSGKVVTETSTIDDVVTGKRMKVREVTRVVDANKHVFEMYGPDPSGKEFKMMEAVYTRK